MQLTLQSARDVLPKYLKEPNNLIHSRESEVVLEALARELGESEEAWGIVGLLHDLDWERTSEDWSNHGPKTVEILKTEGYDIPEDIAHAIISHNETHTRVQRASKLDYALAAGESVTGLIYAYARMRPEKLQGMEASSLNKKFKNESFAANVSRAYINDIEKAGMEKSRFFEIAIQAMQSISAEIGM